MTRLHAIAAIGVVLAANAWAFLSAWQNRRTPEGGTLELTEREAPLQGMPGESTVCLLGIRWDAPGGAAPGPGEPAWLDFAKLAELGFDCSVPVTAEGAAAHYRSLPPREVLVLLEYRDTGMEQPPSGRAEGTRLIAIDAARDAASLRQRHPDTDMRRHAVVRGVVRPMLRTDRSSGTPNPPGPLLTGWLRAPIPGQVYVPQPWAAPLAGYRRPETGPGGPRDTGREPRYAVTLSWGTDHLPWVAGVRPLPPGLAGPRPEPEPEPKPR